MDVNVTSPEDRLRERYVELAEHIQEPYLSEERKLQITREMAYIAFEFNERQKDA